LEKYRFYKWCFRNSYPILKIIFLRIFPNYRPNNLKDLIEMRLGKKKNYEIGNRFSESMKIKMELDKSKSVPIYRLIL